MVYWMYQQASHMIIVRIETDIAPPCAPQQLLLYKATGIFFYTNAPAGGNTGGGVWLCLLLEFSQVQFIAFFPTVALS